MRFIVFFLSFIVFFACKCDSKTDTKLGYVPDTSALPEKMDTVSVDITQLHSWVERGQFFVAGLCDSREMVWRRIWLKIQVQDSAGNPVMLKGQPTAIFRAHSDAVPPRGRTSFFVGWPLSDFSAVPDTCTVTGAGSIEVPKGPILIALEQSGVRVLPPKDPKDPDGPRVEKAFQTNVVLENPLNEPAYKPRLELILYGRDNKIWFVQVIKPEDPAFEKIVVADGKGPFPAQSKRRFGVFITYDNLPQYLKDLLIERAEVLPFEGREL